MRVVPAGHAHLHHWARMRNALWPEEGVAGHRDEARAMLEVGGGQVAFVALDLADRPIGFVEAVLRHDYVNGCDSSPVAFVEGLYVEPAHRGEAVARALVAAVEQWGGGQGCTELASDADITNLASHAFYRAIGFEETERVVYFRKRIG
ncbi:aminoglycoside 6'-N-acetyltransferase [Sphingobium ummariense]|nr:aminoglycoside 6'-N-acetyltransferase [Sphingobium ummariense]